MTFPKRLIAWVDDNRAVLEKHGQVSITHGPPGTDNPSAHVVVEMSADEDVELMIWESGDAEFNRGPFDHSVFEHIDLESPKELAGLLERFLLAVTERM